MVCVFLMTERLPKAIASISVGRLCPSPRQAALPDPCGPQRQTDRQTAKGTAVARCLEIVWMWDTGRYLG